MVNSACLAFWTGVLHVHYLLGAGLATQASTLWNFIFTEFWVFSDRRTKQGRLSRLIRFFIMNNLALAARGPMLYVLTSLLAIHYLISNILSLVLMTVIRYSLASGWIWAAPRAASRKHARPGAMAGGG